jgi:hypothetical protein
MINVESLENKKIKIKPLDVLYIRGSLVIKLKKFETLESEIREHDETLCDIYNDRTIITDVNDNVLDNDDILENVKKYLEEMGSKGLLYNNTDYSSVDPYYFMFKEHLDSKIFRVYITIG